MSALDRVLRDAAAALRAMSDADLIAMAVKASESGAPDHDVQPAERARLREARRGTSRRAEAPKSPALSLGDEEAGEERAPARPSRRRAARDVVLTLRAHGEPMMPKDLAAKVGVTTSGLRHVLKPLLEEGTVVATGTTLSRRYGLAKRQP